MNNKFFSSEEMVEAGKSLVKKTAQQTAKQTSATVQTAASQTLGSVAGSQDGTSEAGSQTNNPQSDQNRKDFVKDLYGAGQNNQHNPSQNQIYQQNGQSPEEQVRIADARKKLLQFHMENYYKPTFDTPKQPEESAAEKTEREEQQEHAKKMEKLQEEQKKNEVPMAVRMGAQKAEKFPGASG